MMTFLRPRISAYAMAFFGTFLVLGCSRLEMDEKSRAPQIPAQSVASASAVDDSASAEKDADSALTIRLVIRSAQIRIRTERPSVKSAEVESLVTARGGYVVHKETEHLDEAVVRSRLELRVPEAHFTSTLSALREQGTVLGESATGDDVTEEYSDVGARLRAKALLEKRLLEMAESAKSVEDMLKVERELGRVRTEIEQMTGRMQFLEKHAAMATISLELISPMQPPSDDGQSIRSKLENAVAQAGNLAVSVIAGGVVLLGAALPLLVPAGFLALLIAMRRRRRLSNGMQLG